MHLEMMAKASKAKYEYLDRLAIKNIVDIMSETKDYDDNFFKQLVEAGKA